MPKERFFQILINCIRKIDLVIRCSASTLASAGQPFDSHGCIWAVCSLASERTLYFDIWRHLLVPFKSARSHRNTGSPGKSKETKKATIVFKFGLILRRSCEVDLEEFHEKNSLFGPKQKCVRQSTNYCHRENCDQGRFQLQ